MENEKPKLERYQKVLIAFSCIFLAIAGIFLVLQTVDILPSGYSSIFLGLSAVLNCCAQWKRSPILNTVLIGLWCLLIGSHITLLILR